MQSELQFRVREKLKISVRNILKLSVPVSENVVNFTCLRRIRKAKIKQIKIVVNGEMIIKKTLRFVIRLIKKSWKFRMTTTTYVC